MTGLDYFQKLYKDKIVSKHLHREADFDASIIKIGNSQGIIIDKKTLDRLHMKVGDEATINIGFKMDPDVEKWENELRDLVDKGPFSEEDRLYFWIYLHAMTGSSEGSRAELKKDENYETVFVQSRKGYLKVRKYLDKHYLNVTVDGSLANLFSKLKQNGISQNDFSTFTLAMTTWLAEGKKKDLLEYFPNKQEWKKKVRIILETQKQINK